MTKADKSAHHGTVSALAIKGHVLGPTTYGFAGQANRLERRGLVAASRGVNTIAQEEPLAAALSFFFCFFSLAVSFGLFVVLGFSCPLGIPCVSLVVSKH